MAEVRKNGVLPARDERSLFMKLSHYRAKDIKRMLLTILVVVAVAAAIVLLGIKLLTPWVAPKVKDLGEGVGKKVEEVKKKLGIGGDEVMPEDAYEYKKHHYYIYDDADSWEDAKEKCEKRGGHLATITSAKEDKKLYQYVEEKGSKDVFFGLQMEVESGEEVWKWVTGEKLKHTKWTEGEPNSDSGSCYVAVYGRNDDSRWRAVTPGYTKYYLCEWEPEEDAAEDGNAEEEAKEESSIPDDAMRFEGHSYYVYQKEGMTWKKAKKSCKKKGGHLVTITSQEEQDAVAGYLLERITPEQDAWIGIQQDETENPWSQWITGEDLKYTNWSDGNPDGFEGQCYGVMCGGERAGENYTIAPGQWDDLKDDDITIGAGYYICEWDTE